MSILVLRDFRYSGVSVIWCYVYIAWFQLTTFLGLLILPFYTCYIPTITVIDGKCYITLSSCMLDFMLYLTAAVVGIFFIFYFLVLSALRRVTRYAHLAVGCELSVFGECVVLVAVVNLGHDICICKSRGYLGWGILNPKWMMLVD